MADGAENLQNVILKCLNVLPTCCCKLPACDHDTQTLEYNILRSKIFWTILCSLPHVNSLGKVLSCFSITVAPCTKQGTQRHGRISYVWKNMDTSPQHLFISDYAESSLNTSKSAFAKRDIMCIFPPTMKTIDRCLRLECHSLVWMGISVSRKCRVWLLLP